MCTGSSGCHPAPARLFSLVGHSGPDRGPSGWGQLSGANVCHSYPFSSPSICCSSAYVPTSWPGHQLPEFVTKNASDGASLVVQWSRICLPMQETQVQSVGQEDPLEKEMATHCSTLAWKVPSTEEPGGRQSMGPHRVGHD